MSVRSPGFDPRRRPRPARPERHARPPHARRITPTPPPSASGGRGPRRASLVALGIIALAALPVGALNLFGASPAATGSPPAGASSPPASTAGTPSASPSPTSPLASPTASPTLPVVDTAIVPVTSFRTARMTLLRRDVDAIVEDAPDRRYAALELVRGDADAILAALGLDAEALGPRLILARDVATLTEHLAAERDRLGFVRADDVTPAVRALGWGSARLFGVGRVASLADWPLRASLPARDGADGYDPAAAWTLFAGGDILLDRGVELAMRESPRGADFPWDGGRVEITSRYCCSSFGWELPRYERTGDEGAMRALISGADLAIANFENPAPRRFRFHASGTVFSADPSRLDGLVDAGLDWVSLANNHIGDAGRQGVLETIEHLDEAGLAHGGAGATLKDARTPRLLEAGGQQVAILAYDAIARSYTARAEAPGSARLTTGALQADIEDARAAGADVVIVFPHWGTEYDATPFAGQQELARQAIDDGADMVIGNHAHWAAALETYRGKPIWYALGNFVFDQTWSEPTMEGVTLELTFRGPTLVQAVMHPHLIIDRAQPNFLDPAGDGRIVLGQIYDASRSLLDW